MIKYEEENKNKLASKTKTEQKGTLLIIYRKISTFLIGNVYTNVNTASRSFGKINCPLGLLISEQTFAIMRFGATPTLHVRPVSW